jgi:hypothetical protein
MKRFMNKKVAVIGVAAGLVLGLGGAAFAYFGAAGQGTGTTTAGSGHAVTLHAAIAGAIVPGDGGQAVTFTADNANATSTYVSTISFVSVTSSNSACNTLLNTTDPGEFSMVQVTSDTTVPASQTGYTLAGTGTLLWADGAYDQSACEGAPLTLTVTTP